MNTAQCLTGLCAVFNKLRLHPLPVVTDRRPNVSDEPKGRRVIAEQARILRAQSVEFVAHLLNGMPGFCPLEASEVQAHFSALIGIRYVDAMLRGARLDELDVLRELGFREAG